MEEKPNYYAVIPSVVRYDDELTANEKLLYGEITALTNKQGECWASNKYFADLYKVHINTASLWIQHLLKKDYIKVDFAYKENTKAIDKRIIKINGKPINKNVKTYQQNYGEGINKNIEGGINKNVEDNNTSINNTRLIKRRTTKKKSIYELIESEFGRTLSPTEYEYISKWEDNDLTRYAIKVAILNNAPRIKYIQAILDSYKSKNIKTVQEAQEDEKKFKRKGVPDWLDKKVEEDINEEAEEFERKIREYHKQQEKS